VPVFNSHSFLWHLFEQDACQDCFESWFNINLAHIVLTQDKHLGHTQDHTKSAKKLPCRFLHDDVFCVCACACVCACVCGCVCVCMCVCASVCALAQTLHPQIFTSTFLCSSLYTGFQGTRVTPVMFVLTDNSTHIDQPFYFCIPMHTGFQGTDVVPAMFVLMGNFHSKGGSGAAGKGGGALGCVRREENKLHLCNYCRQNEGGHRRSGVGAPARSKSLWWDWPQAT